MKRLLSLLLVVAMLFGVCAMFTACDGNTVSSEKEEKKEEKKSNRIKLSMKGVTVEEEIVYDDNGIVLTVTDIVTEENYVSFLFTVENTSSEYRSIECYNTVINGISDTSSGFYQSLADGECIEASISLYIPQLELLQVKKIGHMDLYLTIYDEDYDAIVEMEKVTVNTSEKGFVHTPNYDGEVLFEKNGIRLTLIETSFKKDEEPGMYLLIENETNDPVYFQMQDVELNGWLLPHNGIYTDIMSKTNTVNMISLSGLENMGIKKASDIQNIRFNVYAYDDEYDRLFDETPVAYVPGDKDYVEKMDIEGETLFENDNVEVIMTDISVSGGQPVVEIFLKNSSDITMDIQLNSFEIDGYEAYGSIYLTMPADTQCIYTLYLWADFKVDSIDELDSIIGTLNVYDNETYQSTMQEIEFPLD